MATSKITITLPDEQIDAIRELVAGGKTGSISAFVRHAVDVGLFDTAGWRVMLNDALQETGGGLTKKERQWADTLFRPPSGKAGTSRHSRGKRRAA